MNLKLVIDFGLVILIWIVQLIIYPSFQHISKEVLPLWHSRYTFRITFFVLPLMLGQVILHGREFIRAQDILQVIQVVFILCAWLLTFIKAVPLHNEIQKGIDLHQNIPQLVRWNWPRTIVWTMVFLLGFFHEIKS